MKVSSRLLLLCYQCFCLKLARHRAVPSVKHRRKEFVSRIFYYQIIRNTRWIVAALFPTRAWITLIRLPRNLMCVPGHLRGEFACFGGTVWCLFWLCNAGEALHTCIRLTACLMWGTENLLSSTVWQTEPGSVLLVRCFLSLQTAKQAIMWLHVKQQTIWIH